RELDGLVRADRLTIQDRFLDQRARRQQIVFSGRINLYESLGGGNPERTVRHRPTLGLLGTAALDLPHTFGDTIGCQRYRTSPRCQDGIDILHASPRQTAAGAKPDTASTVLL